MTVVVFGDPIGEELNESPPLNDSTNSWEGEGDGEKLLAEIVDSAASSCEDDGIAWMLDWLDTLFSA